MKISSTQLRNIVKEIMAEQMDVRKKIAAGVAKGPSDKVSINKLKATLDGIEKSGKTSMTMADVQKLVKQALEIPASPMAPGDVSKLPGALEPKKAPAPANVPAPPASVMATKPAFTEGKNKMRISKTSLREAVRAAIKENLALKQEGANETWTDSKGRKFGDCSEPGCASSDTDFEEDKVKGGSSTKWCETHMNPKNRGKGKKTVKEGVSSIQKDLFPGSGKLSKFAEDVDKLLMDTSKEAKELIEEIEEELRVDVLGSTSGTSAPKVAERNRVLMNRVSMLKRLSSNCISMLELLRRE